MAFIVSIATTSFPSTSSRNSHVRTTPPYLTVKQSNKAPLLFVVAPRDQSVSSSKRENPRTVDRDRSLSPAVSEGRDEDEIIGQFCPGCGIFMQDDDPNSPGFYKEPTVSDKADALEGESDDALVSEDDCNESDEDAEDFLPPKKEKLLSPDVESYYNRDLQGFEPVGLGYGNVTEEVLERERQKKEKNKKSKAERKRISTLETTDQITVCARCHSLRNYGQIKNQTAENLIPDFDFDRLVASRLINQIVHGTTTVVIIVVDCVDFDGSFPKKAANSLSKLLEKYENKPNSPKFVLVATKVDLLPSQISPTRLDRWVRQRARAHGVPKLAAVYLVSARKDLGVRNLLSFIKDAAGPRGNVWVVGAQNAGKSTLINSLAKKGGIRTPKLTEAALPGTTIGVLRISDVLSAKANLYDTPGLIHPYLMPLRLNPEEQKMVQIRKELKPRTYRVKVGQAVHIGGLCRVDLKEASVETIYITVWASQLISLHMGKTENSEELLKKQIGLRLQPPLGRNEVGRWVEKEVEANGGSWVFNSIDVTIAGLGWISLGLKGEARVSVWVCEGVDVCVREPLVLDRARFVERPGFWLPKAVSESIGALSKIQSKVANKPEFQSIDS